MNCIFCIVGYSGSGKDTLLKELKKKIDLPVLNTISDRPKRPNEKPGTTICVSMQELNRKIHDGELLEIRTYTTEYRGDDTKDNSYDWTYGTELPTENTSYYAVTSYDQMINIYDRIKNDETLNYQVVPIVVDVHKSILLVRTINRIYGTSFIRDACNGYICLDDMYLDKYDSMTGELCGRLVRDFKQQGDLEKINSRLKFRNNGIDDIAINANNICGYIKSITKHRAKNFNLVRFEDINKQLDHLCSIHFFNKIMEDDY